EGVRLPHDDPVVVTLLVELFTMKRILIDNGSSADILYKHAFDQLRIPADQLKPVKTPLVGFAGETIHPRGSINLSVTPDPGRDDIPGGRYPKSIQCYSGATMIEFVGGHSVYETLADEVSHEVWRGGSQRRSGGGEEML
ncbi:hypothetical protein CFOL_v3_30627, partial [Cephalotus follicularis]